ncbi:MAG: AIM24 family protein, partial [Blautia wexlerae]
TKTLVGSAVSGEGLVNVYRGTGRVLMCPVAPTTSLFESTNTMAAKAAAKSSNTFGK